MGQIHYTFQIHLQFTGGASVEYFFSKSSIG